VIVCTCEKLWLLPDKHDACVGFTFFIKIEFALMKTKVLIKHRKHGKALQRSTSKSVAGGTCHVEIKLPL
jgi:hypothetical protein